MHYVSEFSAPVYFFSSLSTNVDQKSRFLNLGRSKTVGSCLATSGMLEWHHLITNNITGQAVSCYTSVEVSGWLASVAATISAALLVSRALVVFLTAFHAGGRESAGSLRSRTLALFQHHYGAQELAACHTLTMTLGKHVLGQRGHRKLRQHNYIRLLLTCSTGDLFMLSRFSHRG